MLVLASCHQMRTRTTMAHMAMVYRRPAGAMRQSVKPQLASWDRAGHPSQVKLARFLAHVDAIAGPVLATVSSRVAAELIVGFSDGVSLIDGGHDLVNYLFPVAQRLGPERVGGCLRPQDLRAVVTSGGTHPPLAWPLWPACQPAGSPRAHARCQRQRATGQPRGKPVAPGCAPHGRRRCALRTRHPRHRPGHQARGLTHPHRAPGIAPGELSPGHQTTDTRRRFSGTQPRPRRTGRSALIPTLGGLQLGRAESIQYV